MAKQKLNTTQLNSGIKGSKIVVYKNATQSIPATTATEWTPATQIGTADSSLFTVSAGRVTIVSSNIKSVMVNALIQVAATQSPLIIYIYKNGSVVYSTARNADTVTLSAVVDVAQNDYLSIYLYTAGATNTTNNGQWNIFQVIVNETNS